MERQADQIAPLAKDPAFLRVVGLFFPISAIGCTLYVLLVITEPAVNILQGILRAVLFAPLLAYIFSSGFLSAWLKADRNAALDEQAEKTAQYEVARKGHILYRFYDNLGELLYVGITADFDNRAKEHQSQKTWWPEVARSRIEHVASRRELLALERLVIIRERPRYNVVHNQPGGES